MLSLPTTSIILNSENLGMNPTTRPHGTTSILKTYQIMLAQVMNPTTRPHGTTSILKTYQIMLAQVLTTLNLIIEGSQEVEFSNHPKQDKWVV
jgi:hypothetical protein